MFGLPVLFLLLAFDFRMPWDEPFYLYMGGNLNLSQIFDGSQGLKSLRILHILIIHAIVSVTGVGFFALATMMLLYLLALFAFLYVLYQILGTLLVETRRLGFAMIVGAFTPIFLYLAFKTLPDSPALLLAAVATYGVLRSLQGRTTLWLLVVIIALTTTILLKNIMLLLFVSCIVALVLCKRQQFPPGKLIRNAFISGICSFAIITIALSLMGVGLESYLETVRKSLREDEPLISIILHLILEVGVFFLVFPLAFLSRRKDEAVFFTIWFSLATIPILLFTSSIEVRYLASNLPALIGLIYLSIEGLAPRVATWWRRSRALTVAGGCIALAIIIFSNVTALAIMEHEVRIDQFHTILKRLDRLYGQNNYVILTPWSHTDFHYLRFIYPKRRVYNVYRGYEVEPPSPASQVLRFALEDRYYPGRVIRTPGELVTLKAPLVYLGFEENFSVSSLRAITRMVPGINLEKHFSKMNFMNHLTLSWMWDNPKLRFFELVRHGHYVAYAVEVNSEQGSSKVGE